MERKAKPRKAVISDDQDKPDKRLFIHDLTDSCHYYDMRPTRYINKIKFLQEQGHRLNYPVAPELMDLFLNEPTEKA